MTLLDMVHRPSVPIPWEEGDNIPWHQPDFSERMLKEHLSQAHHAASRRSEKIDQHVAWMHHPLLLERPTKILDLCCGPGLYTTRLAKLGHECVGIDYSPASIAYAVDAAEEEKLRCTYIHQDIREAEYGAGFGLVMLISGELNVFKPADAESILKKANHALVPNGMLLLEPQRFASIQKGGEKTPSWVSAQAGLFSDKPHLRLQENFWDVASRRATTRYMVIDAATGTVTRYAQSAQAYTRAQYNSMLVESGFDDVEFFPSLMGTEDEAQDDLMVITARKK